MGAELAVTLLLALLDRAEAIGALIRTGRDEGWSEARWKSELDALAADDDVAKKTLEDAIKKARGG